MKRFTHLSESIKKIVFTISALIIIPLSLGGIALITGSVKLHNQTPPPPPVPKEITNLVQRVGEHTSLPTDETPTVATVSDVAKLQGQLFFKKAKNGDKVLIYRVAKKAYLYRPDTAEVIEVAQLDILSPDATASAEINASSSAGVSITPVLKVKF